MTFWQFIRRRKIIITILKNLVRWADEFSAAATDDGTEQGVVTATTKAAFSEALYGIIDQIREVLR